MSASNLNLTSATVSADSSLRFSAYKFGWGYCAFVIPSAIVCGRLSALDASPQQLINAFEFDKARISLAVAHHGPATSGERTNLDWSDF